MNAQITLFALIGVLFIIGIGVFVWQLSKIQQGQLQASPNTISTTVREYVTACLDIAAANALELLGAQGGVIYQSQGGITPDPSPVSFGKDYVVVEDKKVAYLIYPPQEDIGELFSVSPPFYPWEGFPSVDSGVNSGVDSGVDSGVSTKGYFGINALAPLYNTSPNSIQRQLETFVAKNTQECADWKQFESQGVEIISGEPRAEMLIADTVEELGKEETISFTLRWQIEIRSIGNVANLDTFAANVALPFGKIYYAIRELIDREVQDVNFTINSVHPTGAYAVFVKNNVVNNDDIIMVQFNLKQKFDFQFARHNRMPALFHIPKEPIESRVWHAGVRFATTQNALVISDPCPDSNAPASVLLEGLDPDEDGLIYALQPVPAVFSEPSGVRPPFELRVIASDGEQLDYQSLRIKTTGCPE